MDRARSWNSIAFHPPIPFIPRQKSSIVPGSRKYSSESWFSLSILPSSREISALKYSTRERLYPLRNLSIEYSKRSRCVTRAIGTGLECYPLETWWLETSRCWRDASFVDARRKSLDKQLSKCLESKNNIFEKLDPRFSSRTCWKRRVDFEIT